jgi:DNA repair protein RecO (recombination protein O)
MEWLDDGIVLAARRSSETGMIITLLTNRHGRHSGWVNSKYFCSISQQGTFVAAKWRARLEDHLGGYALEPKYNSSAAILDEPLRLAALASACALLKAALPERVPYPNIYDGLAALLKGLPKLDWDAAYVRWEIELLAALGFGLDLNRCAVTGVTENLVFVSPNSGCAVSAAVGRPYADKLLALPGFLIGCSRADPDSVLTGLNLTGYFFSHSLFRQVRTTMPLARKYFATIYQKYQTRY